MTRTPLDKVHSVTPIAATFFSLTVAPPRGGRSNNLAATLMSGFGEIASGRGGSICEAATSLAIGAPKGKHHVDLQRLKPTPDELRLKDDR